MKIILIEYAEKGKNEEEVSAFDLLNFARVLRIAIISDANGGDTCDGRAEPYGHDNRYTRRRKLVNAHTHG